MRVQKMFLVLACLVLVSMTAFAQQMGNQRPTKQGAAASKMTVAILIFPGVQIIDYTGPYEVFGHAGFQIFTVAEKPDMLTTAMGMQVTPNYTFDNHPTPDVLMLP